MAKFTSGKWEAREDGDVLINDWIWLTNEGGYIDPVESFANARLIAAAPELYKMLELATEWIEELEINSIIARTSRKLLNRIDGAEVQG